MEIKPGSIADVSIISANYNNGEYLDHFIRSIINSSFWPKELVIVDDGSTDNSVDILRSFAKLPFLNPIFFEQNRGFTVALNAGLEVASATYVMRADPDDVMMPERIERQVAWMKEHPGTDVLGCNCVYFLGNEGKMLNRSNFPLTHDQIAAAYLRGEHGLLHATVCVKREVYQKYRYQELTPGEDYELFARMTRDGRRFANLADPLYMVRVHKGSASSQIRREAISRTFRFRDEIFRTKTSQTRVWLYYWHIWHYRRSMLARYPLSRFLHLVLSAICYPQKLLKRL